MILNALSAAAPAAGAALPAAVEVAKPIITKGRVIAAGIVAAVAATGTIIWRRHKKAAAQVQA